MLKSKAVQNYVNDMNLLLGYPFENVYKRHGMHEAIKVKVDNFLKSKNNWGKMTTTQKNALKEKVKKKRSNINRRFINYRIPVLNESNIASKYLHKDFPLNTTVRNMANVLNWNNNIVKNLSPKELQQMYAVATIRNRASGPIAIYSDSKKQHARNIGQNKVQSLLLGRKNNRSFRNLPPNVQTKILTLAGIKAKPFYNKS